MSVPRLSSTPLPGIGVRYDLTTRDSRRLAVVAHRDGHRTISAYREDDPDACDPAAMSPASSPATTPRNCCWWCSA
jgi:TrkA domain protein